MFTGWALRSGGLADFAQQLLMMPASITLKIINWHGFRFLSQIIQNEIIADVWQMVN